jgi:hypothetical protein
MKTRNYLLLLAIACLVVGGCSIPAVTINVDQGESSPEGQTAPAQEVSPSSQEARAPAPGEPTPTNTLVVPPASDASPSPEPPGAAPTGEPQAPSSPLPTAIVDPELAALWEYVVALEEEVVQPLEEMGETLEDLGLGSGGADIFALCTGVDVVLSALAEVQQGLDNVDSPPTDDADLQLAYSELRAAMDDMQEGFSLLQSACQTKNLGAVLQAAGYLESGGQHMDNVAQALERWQATVGL